MFTWAIKKLYSSFLNLLYPPFCLHCSAGLVDDQVLLCEICTDLLDFLNPTDRCVHCFSENRLFDHFYCLQCDHSEKFFCGFASVFTYAESASSIIKKLKYSDMPYLSRGVGAYMVSQFIQLDWPIPDIIVPVPLSLTHMIQRGYNQSLLIAHEIGNYLNVPVKDILLRQKNSYSQEELLPHQRQNLCPLTFILKKNISIENQVILLIDDVYTTGTTLKYCAEVLLSGKSKNIYALTFCKEACSID